MTVSSIYARRASSPRGPTGGRAGDPGTSIHDVAVTKPPGTFDRASGVPESRTLDGDGLDLLELVAVGALPALPAAMGIPTDREVLLTDTERTPLARSKPGVADLEMLRPFTRGEGLHWDPALRRSTTAVQADLRPGGGVGSCLAVVWDDVATIGDVEAAIEATRAADAGHLLWVILVSRAPHPVGSVGSAGRVRAVLAVAEDVVRARPGITVTPLVLPWPADPAIAASIDLERVTAAFGASSTVRPRDRRSQSERERIAALSAVVEREVHALYPAAAAEEVLRARRGATRRGAVVLLTGLSGSGKSTIARALVDDLGDVAARDATLLDGDEVRQLLSGDLGFDAGSRETNLRRVMFVAALVAAHGGIAVAALIAPFASSRRWARDAVRGRGAFVLVHISTPLDVCERRDRKGLYARARTGELADFTGISSPYEPPDDADVVIDTSKTGVAEAVRLVRDVLDRRLAEPGDTDR
jgi:sulfate adenylyltransferase